MAEGELDNGISDRVKAFLAGQIDSVVQLEALLLLHANPNRQFTADEVARELRIDSAWSEPNLKTLCDKKVIVCVSANPAAYQYGPQSQELKETIDELSQSYATRRVSVISLIFSKPPGPLQHFADAFRLRKDNSDG